MASYLILGAGKFGRLALERLTACDPTARFAIVDQSSVALALIPPNHNAHLDKIQAEVAEFVREHLSDYAAWDWLIPMVPVHVAAIMLKQELAADGWEFMEVPQAVADLAPVAVRGHQGELYLSRATHLCPDDCSEPGEVCPVSGESRTPALFEMLAALTLPGFQVVVLASRQLAPGVGGYPPRELLGLADTVSKSRANLAVATACRCHGVMHALRQPHGEG
jgi:hypothetical protein